MIGGLSRILASYKYLQDFKQTGVEYQMSQCARFGNPRPADAEETFETAHQPPQSVLSAGFFLGSLYILVICGPRLAGCAMGSDHAHRRNTDADWLDRSGSGCT